MKTLSYLSLCPRFLRSIMLVLLIGLFSTLLSASPFKRIVSFGDSLADKGNAYQLTNGQFPPDPPYYQGRFSNGLVWVEYLAGDLQIPLVNYALGGSKTGDSNYSIAGAPGLTQQVDQFLADTGSERVHPRDLFTVIVGANDWFAHLVLGEPAPIPSGIANTAANIERLVVAGARQIVVMNVPDLSVTPAFGHLTPAQKAGLSYAIGVYNTLLAAELSALSVTYNCNIVVVDIYATLNDMVLNPATYGLVEVHYPVLSLVPVDPNTALFFDGVHPTTFGHSLLADEALESILQNYFPGEAIGLDGNVPGWVHR